MFEAKFEIEFGDCDPAGIVFYPRFFAWFDATLQKWLRAQGIDQSEIRERLGTFGTGVINVRADFRAPLAPGDTLILSIADMEWSERTFSIRYEGRTAGNLCVEGTETRGLFAHGPEGRLRLVPLDDLRAMLAV